MNLLLLATHIATAEAISYGPFGAPDKPYRQDMVDSRNILKYTGWQGPYSDRRGYGINRDAPEGTRVDQVVQLTRHGERWPDRSDFEEQEGSLAKVRALQGSLKGSLAFANEWIPYAEAEDGWLSEESLIGPYSGHLRGYEMGVNARRRYFDLYDGKSILPIFSSGYERIIDTARHFGEGFLQWNYTALGAINIIQETADQGANSLVPLCHAEIREQTKCSYPQNSTEVNSPWLYPQYDTAVVRLNNENPELNLTRSDIPHLIAVGAFELNVRGSSPWVDVFTAEEWNAFEYAQSSLYYCFYGPGSTTGPSKGSVFLNATRTLLVQGPNKGLPLYFNFAHDTDIIQLLAAMGVDEVEEWNAYEVQFGQKWDVTDMTPQGAHIVFERLIYEDNPSLELHSATKWASNFPAAFDLSQNLTAVYPSDLTDNMTDGDEFQACTEDQSASDVSNIFVRVVLNEAVIPLNNCSSGPGYSCPLAEFNDWVDRRLSQIPEYSSFCNIPKGSPKYLDFFWNYNTTTSFAAVSELSYQKGLVSWNDMPIQK